MDTIKPLFNVDDDGQPFVDGEIDESSFKLLTDDDTSTNTDESPDIEFHHFGAFAVNDTWMSKYNEDTRTPHESYEMKLLREELYEIFIASPFYEKYKDTKKTPKHDILKVFLYFYDNIKEKTRYTIVEKFIEISDFMNISYDILFKELPMLYKQSMIAELDKKYHLFDKKKVHKLF